MARRRYPVSLTINNCFIQMVIIDDHYEEKHSSSINDELILQLVSQLDQKYFEPVEIKEPYSFFVIDRLEQDGKHYKLIWLLEENEIYVGIVNAYRRNKREGEK